MHRTKADAYKVPGQDKR